MFNTIIKRDGRTAAYDVEKIARAIFRAATSVGGKDYQTAYRLALQVQQRLEEKYPPSHLPTVEQIQDMVEKVLIENGHSRTAKEYILYRAQRTRVREMNTAPSSAAPASAARQSAKLAPSPVAGGASGIDVGTGVPATMMEPLPVGPGVGSGVGRGSSGSVTQ